MVSALGVQWSTVGCGIVYICTLHLPHRQSIAASKNDITLAPHGSLVWPIYVHILRLTHTDIAERHNPDEVAPAGLAEAISRRVQCPLERTMTSAVPRAQCLVTSDIIEESRPSTITYLQGSYHSNSPGLLR